MDGKKLSLKIMDSGIRNGKFFFVPAVFEREIESIDKGAKIDMELVYVRDDMLVIEYTVDYDGGEVDGSVYLYENDDKAYWARLFIRNKGGWEELRQKSIYDVIKECAKKIMSKVKKEEYAMRGLAGLKMFDELLNEEIVGDVTFLYTNIDTKKNGAVAEYTLRAKGKSLWDGRISILFEDDMWKCRITFANDKVSFGKHRKMDVALVRMLWGTDRE